MPLLNGLEATKQIRRDDPDARVLVLTMYGKRRIRLANAPGRRDRVVLKKVAGSELVYAIRAIFQGEAFLYPSITKRVVEDYLQRVKIGQERDTFDDLTDREREVLQLIAEGHTSKEIADLLNLSVRTVQNHALTLWKAGNARPRRVDQVRDSKRELSNYRNCPPSDRERPTNPVGSSVRRLLTLK